MEGKILLSYKSRRNRAGLIQTAEGQVVVKTFSEEAAFRRELQIYRLLQDSPLPCARLLRADAPTLVLSRLPGQTLLDCLEEQERTGLPAWEVWEKLVWWLTELHRRTGFVMTDPNLRNFIYDDQTGTLYGLDFEECSPGSMILPAARVAAFLRTYAPARTPLKQEISQYVLHLFAQNCELEDDTLFLESERQEELLLQRRNHKST